MRYCTASLLVALNLVSGAPAYVEAPYSLGQVCHESTTIVLVEVTKVNKEKNLIVLKEHSGSGVESCEDSSIVSSFCLMPDWHSPPPRDYVACCRECGCHVVTVQTQAAAPRSRAVRLQVQGAVVGSRRYPSVAALRASPLTSRWR